SATRSSMPRRCSASASCARVRGAVASIRRQRTRARASGSYSSCSPSAGEPDSECGSGIRRGGGLGLGAALGGGRGGGGLLLLRGLRLLGGRIGGRRGGVVPLHRDAQLLLDLLLDLQGHVGVVPQEVAGVLLALAELGALVGVPGAGLAHDAVLHAQVDQAALAGDADAVQDVELGLLERRGGLV